MLEIDGHRLTQSLAIIGYLDATRPEPPLLPSDPADAAQVRAMALAVACDIHPLNNLRVLKYLSRELGQPQEARDAWYRHWVTEGLEALEAMARTSAGDFLFGDAVGARRHLPRPAALQCAAFCGVDRRLSDAAPGRRECQRAHRLRRSASRPPGGPRMNRADTMNRGMSDAKPITAVDIPSLKGKVSDEEWAIRVDLAAAYRLVAHYGWDDLIFTHLSARIPGPEHHFLLNPYNLMFEEVTASSLVKVDVHGNPVDPTPFITNPAGFTIHSAVHMAREDAHAVMHLHTPHGQAVSAHAEGLLPLTQTAMLVRGDLAFHDYEGVAVDLDERERIVADLGTKSAMLLRNHGTLAVGRNVGEAFVKLYFLERACQAQIYALSAGDNVNNPPQGAPEVAAEQGAAGLTMAANLLAWPALLRKAHRLDPAFAT